MTTELPIDVSEVQRAMPEAESPSSLLFGHAVACMFLNALPALVTSCCALADAITCTCPHTQHRVLPVPVAPYRRALTLLVQLRASGTSILP
jgi:hypothetical protein